MRRHLRRSTRKMFSARAWKVRLVFWLGALLVGLVSALFAKMADVANGLFFDVVHYNHYLPLLLTPLGMLLTAWLTVRFFPGSQGSGIPQAIAALHTEDRSKLLSTRIAIGKIILTQVALVCGASVGREGPSVHVGAAIMYSLGRLAHFRPHYMERALILAGSAAGIAAAFNTPLAGVMFAIEEMSKSFESRANGIVIIAVVIAGVTALGVLGPYHYFGEIHNVPVGTVQVWLASLICGIGGGLFGGLFGVLLVVGGRRLADVARRSPMKVALVAGIVLALIAFVSDYSASGTGYLHAKEILSNPAAEHDPWYPVYKLFATIASYLTGIPGGIFAPSLATGAGVGADLGHWFPVAPLSVMVLLGMVGYFSGVVQSPLTAFVIVMEMTAERDMILPLLATAFIGYGASQLVNPYPLYHTMAQAFIGDGPRRRR